MDFQNIVCWDIDEVRRVMNTNAELASRDIFLAVHSEYPLTASNPREDISRESSSYSLDPHQFLETFLSEDYRHMQVAVLGDSGSGKSHLIRWMELSIPQDEKRHIISVPRSGISLRGVIELILKVLPNEEARPYYDRLNQAEDEQSTPDRMEERLLSEIALAINGDAPSSDGNPDLESDLIEELPYLFHDPYLREYLRQAGGVVEQLASQVLSESNEYTPAPERREFSRVDIPLSGIQANQMSAAARGICDFLRNDEEATTVAVQIINRNLDKALGQVLNFTGDRLMQLLMDVRKHLRSLDQELVLLVEDLARLQGLDLSLLDALIEEGSESNQMCRLRWAAAVTTGYYARIPDTVKTRMNYVLNMDLATSGGDGHITDRELLSFSARYLNAARLSKDELASWATLPDDQRSEIPSACAECPHLSPCHRVFGSINGVGLYPFNELSLPNMLRRVDSNLDERFNPRVLVKDVLAEVLGTYGRDIQNSNFPPERLLRQMGGPKLSALATDEIRRQNPEDADRQLVALELWGNGTSAPVDLPQELFVSFGLHKPLVAGASRPSVTQEQEAFETPRTRNIDNRIEAIDDWANGARMQDNLVNYVRPLIHNAILSHIDWDCERLVQTHFASSSSGLFRRDSISFEGQLTQAARRPVTLRIPLIPNQQNLSEAAIALEALHLFQLHGNWNFDNGSLMLETLGNCLDEWSRHLVHQMKQTHLVEGTWDVSSAAVELLTVGAALAGRPPRKDARLTDWLNSLLEEWPSRISAQSPEWNRLYQMLARERPALIRIALARASGSKGGQRGAFIVPSKIIAPLRRVRREWELSHHPTADSVNRRDDIGTLAKLHIRIQTDLANAAKAEWILRTDWIDEWRNSVPGGVGKREVVEAVRELLNLARANGIGLNRQRIDYIESSLSGIETVQLEGALEGAMALREEKVPVRRLAELGRNNGGNTRDAVKRFIPAAHGFMAELEAAISSHITELDQSSKDIQDHQANIGGALSQLSRDLGVIEGKR